MAPPVPTYVPSELTLGTTWVCALTLSDYPTSEGWSAVLRFLPSGDTDTPVAATGVADPLTVGLYQFTVPAADTAGMCAGPWSWVVLMQRGSDTFLPLRGGVSTLPDPSLATGKDVALATPPSATQMLALVDRAIAAILQGGNQAWSIGIRTFTKLDLAELRTMRASLVAAIRRERTGSPLGSIRLNMHTVSH